MLGERGVVVRERTDEQRVIGGPLHSRTRRSDLIGSDNAPVGDAGVAVQWQNRHTRHRRGDLRQDRRQEPKEDECSDGAAAGTHGRQSTRRRVRSRGEHDEDGQR